MSPLPYAPRRKRPLSLWNPLDYLVLLCWVFYFPQAVRWFVEEFGSLPWTTDGWQAVRKDPIQRRLAVQGLLLAIATPFFVAFLFQGLGIDIDFSTWRSAWRTARRSTWRSACCSAWRSA